MTFMVALNVEGEPNIAMFKVTTIEDRSAVDIAYMRKPTQGEIDVAQEAVRAFLEMQSGEREEIVGSECIADEAERHAAMRKFLGGGQG